MDRIHKRFLRAIATALARALRGLSPLRPHPSEQPVDWGCLDALLQVAQYVTLAPFGSNPVAGLYVISWRPDDIIAFHAGAPLHAELYYDCLDAIFDAGLQIFAVAWPGADQRPVRIAICDRSYRIDQDGTVLEGDDPVGCLIQLGDDHQAFVILASRKVAL